MMVPNLAIGNRYAAQLQRCTGGDTSYDAAVTRQLRIQIAELRRADPPMPDVIADWERAIAGRDWLNARMEGRS